MAADSAADEVSMDYGGSRCWEPLPLLGFREIGDSALWLTDLGIGGYCSM
jgi:hypothetical protein